MASKALKHFKKQPKPGEIFMLEGQRYELLETVPYKRTDGTSTHLLVWQSHCADCGQPFETKTGMTIYGLNRRCEKHKSPGKRVVKKTKRQYPFWKKKKRSALKEYY